MRRNVDEDLERTRGLVDGLALIRLMLLLCGEGV